jgi:hypothetical protein
MGENSPDVQLLGFEENHSNNAKAAHIEHVPVVGNVVFIGYFGS